MKIQSSLVILLVFAICHVANSQSFEITSKDNFKVKGYLDPNDFYYDYKVHSVFKNTASLGSIDTVFVWEKKIIKMTSGWYGTVCDPINCHPDEISISSFNKSVGKTGLLDVGFMPQEIAGEAIVELKVYPAEKPQLAKTYTYSFVIDKPTAVDVAGDYILSNKLFPNPTNGNLNIDMQLKTNQNVRLEIRDLNGKQVFASLLGTGTSIKTSLDVLILPQGVYQISYFADDLRIITKSFVKI